MHACGDRVTLLCVLCYSCHWFCISMWWLHTLWVNSQICSDKMCSGLQWKTLRVCAHSVFRTRILRPFRVWFSTDYCSFLPAFLLNGSSVGQYWHRRICPMVMSILDVVSVSKIEMTAVAQISPIEMQQIYSDCVAFPMWFPSAIWSEIFRNQPLSCAHTLMLQNFSGQKFTFFFQIFTADFRPF